MQRKGSIVLPILFTLFIISLLAVAGVFYLYQKEHAQNIKLQGQIVELDNLARNTASKLDESKKLAADLTLKLQEAKGQIDSLSSELAVEKTAHEDVSNKLEQFKADLSQQKSLREDLENRLKQVQDDGKQINEQLKIMQQQRSALEEKIKNLEAGASGVELGRVVINPEPFSSDNDTVLDQSKNTDKKNNALDAKVLKVVKNQPSHLAKGLEGKVIIVNKEFNFVVINLGSKDKVSVGDEFLVSRAGKPIGNLKVEKVHEVMSAAGFPAELRDLIKENDLVTQKIK